MSRTFPISLAVATTFLAVIASAADAQPYRLHAGSDPDSQRIVRYTAVPYSDLDLSSSAGAGALLQRIDAAAAAVCGGEANAVSKRQKEDYAECRGIAVAIAVRKMHSPALTSLASARRAQLRAAN